jgi:orotate phosphoribosyltransferase
VNDVLTTGDGILEAAQILRKAANVSHAVVYLDRDQGGRKRLEQENIRVEGIIKPSDLDISKSESFQVGGDELFQVESKP